MFLVPMHGGIWTLCVNLDQNEIDQLHKEHSFPRQEACVNYLSGNMENSKNQGLDEPRQDWQHSEFQTTLHPHLSRYTKCVVNPSKTKRNEKTILYKSE